MGFRLVELDPVDQALAHTHPRSPQRRAGGGERHGEIIGFQQRQHVVMGDQRNILAGF
ncbi:hypothetical protein D3C78_1975290 [compost metagenome]